MDYKKIYDQIIARAKSRVVRDYVERHHITPRCLGGSDDPHNIAILTAREHFLCHWLLSRLYPDSIKLAHSFLMMCKAKGIKQQRYIPSSRVFEEARQRVSALKKGKPNRNHSLALKGRIQLKESVEKMKATRELKGINKQHSQKMRGNKFAAANAGRIQTEQERVQRSLSQPNKRVCIIDNKQYHSASQAARELNLPQKTVWARLNSTNFPNYRFSC